MYFEFCRKINKLTVRKLNYIYASDGLFAIYVMNGTAPSLTLPHPGEGKDNDKFNNFEWNG
jgi:hypothetical protein